MDTTVGRLLRDARQGLASATKALDDLEARLDATTNGMSPTTGWGHRRGKLLWLIAQKGGEVTQAEFYGHGGSLGYDRRGLGGFFTGRYPTLEIDPETGNRRLTKTGKFEAERWYERFGKTE